MPENYFDERIARIYEAKWPELFDPAAIDPVVGFLADLAGAGAAFPCTGSTCHLTWSPSSRPSRAATRSA